MSAAFGQQIKQDDIDQSFLTGPGEDLVIKTIQQMASIPGFLTLFGPFDPNDDQQRWADYARADWSLRQLPAINVFEAEAEDKTSDQAWLNGTVSFQIFWPASFRRTDMRRVEVAFKGAMENFFSSKFVTKMLDELYWIQRPMKVFGLNEYGKVLTWTPNTEGIVEDELVPVTIINARYRIDLRSWYRALEFMDRTKDSPFEQSLDNLNQIVGSYQGVTDPVGDDVVVTIDDNITVTNP